METLNKLALIGVPTSQGQGKPGTEKGPDCLRDAGLVKLLQGLGQQVTCYDDVSLHVNKSNEERNEWNVRNSTQVLESSIETADKVEQCLRSEGHCLAIGGDHSMAIGTLMGHARVHPDMVVLWIDAHADINTPLTSDSGNLHGMPLSFVTKELDPYVPHMPGWEKIQPCLSANQIAWIGLRNVDPGERKIMETFDMKAYSMHEVDTHGVREVLHRALRDLDPTETKPIHASFDIDSTDPAYIPSTGTPVSGGLSIREAFFIAEELANTGRLAMVDIAEVNPCIGTQRDVDLTVKNTLNVISHFFGNKRRGVTPPGYELPRAAVRRCDRLVGR